MDRLSKAKSLEQLSQHPGWQVFSDMAKEIMSEAIESFTEIMDKKPEALTGRTALKHGFTYKAVKKLLDDVEDEINFARTGNPKGPGRGA